MAMPVHLTVWSSSENQAQVACKAAFRRITALESILSDYDERSELMQVGQRAASGPISTSRELTLILEKAKAQSEATHGAFDPTAGPVIRLWRTARENGQLPASERHAAAMKLLGTDKVLVDRANQTVELLVPGMSLDLGGIAKGFIGDEVMHVLRRHGLPNARYRAGGDIVLGDAPPGRDGWLVDLPQLPDLVLANCGVSVSGDTMQFVEIDGKRYSHVIDPRTGMGVTSRQMAVVVAPTGMESDALATAGCVMPRAEFEQLTIALRGVRAWIMDASDGE